MKTGKAVILAACACLLGACHNDRDDDRRSGTAERAMEKSDSAWIQDVAQGGMSEVRLSEMATTQAQSEEVRRFARRLVNDHTNANNDLRTVARGEGVTLPGTLDTHHREMAQNLARSNGTDFDRGYLRMMVDNHNKTVEKFEAAAAGASDAEVRAFAERTLPTLREHQRMAKEIADRLGAR
ncbi:MAG: DUF4142 domain-containing protein [Phycisphaerales bacterium]|nr:DUF4142 domain-containing protein [Phycisphaerales bacterium]